MKRLDEIEARLNSAADDKPYTYIAEMRVDQARLLAVVREVEALRERVASSAFEALTRDSTERSLTAALSKLGGAS